jgi:tetratricopeptide (TPR) repeat protein
MKASLILYSLFAMILLAGCATTSVNLPVTRPAEVDLSDYSQIAIGDFQGDRNQHKLDISDMFTAKLLESDYFDAVLDRQHLYTILREHDLAWYGYVDETTAPELGRFIGAAAIVFGRVTRDRYREVESEQEIIRKDEDGNEYTVIKKTRKGTYDLAVRVQITDIETARIILARTYETSRIATEEAENHVPAPINVHGLFQDCAQDISEQFIRTIAPYDIWLQSTYELDHKYLPELETAREQVLIGDYFTALEILERAAERPGLEDKSRAKAYYNLGVIQMYLGDYDNSLANLRTALELQPGKKLYVRAINTCRQEQANAALVEEQLN